MQQTAGGGLPVPLISCLLPKDEHVWWAILQYLKSAGFGHTASALKLELLSTRGVHEDRLEAITEVGL
jgi:hypothetical protein